MMRISEADRQRVAAELRRHVAAGRLTVDEYETRLGDALAATTLAELDGALRDLPMVRIADPDGGGGALVRSDDAPPRHRAPGTRTRWQARMVVLFSVMVLSLAVFIGLVAQTAWVLLLVFGWLIGLVQGRVGRRSGGW